MWVDNMVDNGTFNINVKNSGVPFSLLLHLIFVPKTLLTIGLFVNEDQVSFHCCELADGINKNTKKRKFNNNLNI